MDILVSGNERITIGQYQIENEYKIYLLILYLPLEKVR